MQQKTEELTYATEYYNSFIAAWKGSIIDDIFNCDNAGLSEAIKFVNFEPVEAFTSYGQPRNGLNPRAQEINHITDEDVSEAPFIEEVLPLFDSFVGDKCPIVGQNLSFDYNFLYSTGSRAIVANGLTNGRKFYDTLSLSKREYDYYQKYNLDFLARRVLGVMRKDSHTALSDALTAGLLFIKIYEKRTSS